MHARDHLLRLDPGGGQQALLDPAEQVEHPQAAGYPRVDEVGEAGEGEVDLAGGVGHGQAQQHHRYGGVVVRHRPEAAGEQGDGHADPHRPALEEAVHQALLVLAADHGQTGLGDGIAQPFPLHPLAPQDHGDGDHADVEGQQEDRPPHERLDPGAVGDALAGPGDALEEQGVPGAVVDQDPVLGEVGEELLPPLVLRRGVVEDGGERGQDQLGEAHGAHRRDHGQHGIDHDQVGPVEGQAAAAPRQRHVGDGADQREGGEDQSRRMHVDAAQRPAGPEPGSPQGGGEGEGRRLAARRQLEGEVEEPDEHDEDEDRPRGADVGGHVGALDDHVAVGGADGEEEAQEAPHEEPPPRQAVARFEKGLGARPQVPAVDPGHRLHARHLGR